MRYLITGGGTAGHVNPGVAIAKYIKAKEPESEILFVGTQRGLESTLVPREGFKIKYIDAKGFKRKLSLDTIKTLITFMKGYSQSKKIIKQFKPDIVIGTGGYVCGPVVLFATRKNIPTLIHEQNAYPGITNRFLSRYVNTVAISFKSAKNFFKSANNVVFTGNPIRSELFNVEKSIAREKLSISKEQTFVVIFGGSLGAEKINTSIIEISKYSLKENIKILYATGKKHYESIKDKIDNPQIEVVPYIYDMGNALNAADLVVSRAGAITLAELTAVGTPSVLIPSPYVTANHQEHNARELENKGASVVITEKDLNGEMLFMQIKKFMEDKNLLKKMASASAKMGIKDADSKLYMEIKKLT